jgi:hypothetical protein
MPNSAETLEYIASLVKELAEMSEDLGRPTLSYLLRMAVVEASRERRSHVPKREQLGR